MILGIFQMKNGGKKLPTEAFYVFIYCEQKRGLTEGTDGDRIQIMIDERGGKMRK